MSDRKPWTRYEDGLLTQAVALYGENDMWPTISQMVPNRSNKACRKRWLHSLSPSLRKTSWTAQEDKELLRLYHKHGQKWAVIARGIAGRTDDACARRYKEFLDPALNREKVWSPEEDVMLVQLQAQYGNEWTLIGQKMSRQAISFAREKQIQSGSIQVPELSQAQTLTRMSEAPSTQPPSPIPYPSSSVISSYELSPQLWTGHLFSEPQITTVSSHTSSPLIPSSLFSPASTVDSIIPSPMHLSNAELPPFQPSSSSLSAALTGTSFNAPKPLPVIDSPSIVLDQDLILYDPGPTGSWSNSSQAQIQTQNDSYSESMDFALLDLITSAEFDASQDNTIFYDQRFGSFSAPTTHTAFDFSHSSNIPFIPSTSSSNTHSPHIHFSNDTSIISPHGSGPFLSAPSDPRQIHSPATSSNATLFTPTSSTMTLYTLSPDSQPPQILSPKIKESRNPAMNIFRLHHLSPISSPLDPALPLELPDTPQHSSPSMLFSSQSPSQRSYPRRVEIAPPSPKLSKNFTVPDPEALPYTCGYERCLSPSAGARFKTSKELFEHNKSHEAEFTHKVRPFRCGLEGCDKSWKSINGLQYHLQVSKDHYQTALEFAFEGKPHLPGGAHNTTEEADKTAFKVFACKHPGCTKVYRQLSGLKYHNLHGHPQEKPAQLNSVPPTLARKVAKKLEAPNPMSPGQTVMVL